MVTAGEILASLSAEFTLAPDNLKARGSAPAETFRVNGGPDRVGIIGSVTRPFCGTCNRVRLTADGQVRNCLFAATETDLRAPLRSGARNNQLAGLWRTAVAAKLPGHGISDPGSCSPPGPCPLSAAKSLPASCDRSPAGHLPCGSYEDDGDSG